MGARIGLGLKEETWKWVVEQDWKLSRKAEKGGVRICVCVCVCVCLLGERRGERVEHVEDGCSFRYWRIREAARPSWLVW